MKAIILTFIGLIPTVLFGQNLNGLTKLDLALEKNSGITYVSDRIITVNNVPGDNNLYEVNPETGAINRSVLVLQSTNIDWASLMSDENFIYIFDIGNDGNRQYLKVYLVPIQDFLTQSVVQPSVIKYRYPDLNEQNAEWDASAALVMNGDIYIFTEGSETGATRVYTLPMQPGTYEAQFACELNVGVNLTGATVNSDNEAVLIGLDDSNNPKMLTATLSNNTFTVASSQDLMVPESYSTLLEGVCSAGEGYFFSARNSGTDIEDSGLLSLETPSTAAIASNEIAEVSVSPNPADEFVTLNTEKAGVVSIYTTSGTKVWESSILPGSTRVETSQWNSGMYIVSLEGSSQPIKMMVK